MGAGAVAQTVWNLAHGFDAALNIKDCDLVYFDQRNLTYEAEDAQYSEPMTYSAI